MPRLGCQQQALDYKSWSLLQAPPASLTTQTMRFQAKKDTDTCNLHCFDGLVAAEAQKPVPPCRSASHTAAVTKRIKRVLNMEPQKAR